MGFIKGYTSLDDFTKYALWLIMLSVTIITFTIFLVMLSGCACNCVSTEYYLVGKIIYKAVRPAGWVQSYGPVHGSQSIHIRRVYRSESYYFILQTSTGDIWMKIIHSEDEFRGTPLQTIVSCRGAHQLQTKEEPNS